ncbi:MAG: hypothetical protein ACO3JV_12470, partial [Pseudomonadales bacterium]
KITKNARPDPTYLILKELYIFLKRSGINALKRATTDRGLAPKDLKFENALSRQLRRCDLKLLPASIMRAKK